MEEIYVSAEYFKSDNPIPSTINPKSPRSSKRSFYSGVTLSLGLLSVLLLIGLITLGVYLHDSTASLSAMSSKLSSMNEERDHLKANLSTMRDKLSSVIENRNLLNASLTEKTEELERLQNLSKQKKTCPAGWKMFSCSCYLLSQSSDSWDAGRNKCRERGADLAVIDSAEEQRKYVLKEHGGMFNHSCYYLSEKRASWDEGRKYCRDKGADLVVTESLEEQITAATKPLLKKSNKRKRLAWAKEHKEWTLAWLPQHSAATSHPIWFVLSGTSFVFQQNNDRKQTSRLCKGYLTKKEGDGVLHQIT